MATDIHVDKTSINKNTHKHNIKMAVSFFYIILSNAEKNISEDIPVSQTVKRKEEKLILFLIYWFYSFKR